jgi:hypothetical protein
VVYRLASSYKITNPVLGIVPGSPSKKRDNSELDDREAEIIDDELQKPQSGWQMEALVYTAEHIDGGKKRFDKFCNDETLDRIRRSKVLNHSLHNKGGRKEARNRQTGEVKEMKKSLPRCIVCYNVAKSAKEKNKAPQTVWHCVTCRVPLCQEVRGRNKHSCSYRWHALKDLSSIRRTASVTPASTARKKPRVEKL